MNRAVLEVEVLSSAAGRSSGYLLRHGSTQVLIDCGPGTALALCRSGRLDAIDAVVVTHQHADHASDVIGLAYARCFPDPMAPIPLLAPASTLRALEHLDDLFAVPTLPQISKSITTAFELQPLAMDGTSTSVAGHLELTSFAVAHAVPSAGLRFTAGNTTVAFSSDTGACDALIEVARDADLFICEATYLEATPDQLEGHGHLTPRLAATTAERASVRHLLLCHFSWLGDVTAAVDAARQAFGSNAVSAATDGSVVSA